MLDNVVKRSAAAAAAVLLLAGSAMAAAPPPPCPKVSFTAADVPASCKSRDASVVCGNCIDAVVDKIAPQLPTDYPCALSDSYMSNCISPFIGPLAGAGANLQALMGCDPAASMARIKAKGVIKCV